MRNLVATTRVFLTVLFLGLFAMAARNVVDPDVWWHLKTGEYIAEHKGVPHADPFSYTRAGQPWVAHEWLTEVLLYELQRTIGFGGLTIFFAAVIATSLFLLYLRCGDAPYIAGTAILFSAFATMPLWGVRPQILSFLLTSLWVLILERSERNARLLWWTLPLTLLWVNLHAGFALGLALSALCLAGEGMERALGRSPVSEFRLRTAALVLLLDFVIVPLNPNGVRLFWYPIQTLRSPAMQKYIVEWASPNFHHLEYLPFFLLLLAMFAILSWSQSRVRLRDLLLLIFSLYAALCSIRMIPLFVLVATPLIAKRLGTWPHTLPRPRPLSSPPRILLNSTILLAMLTFATIRVVQVVHRQPQAEAQQFPSGAVAFLKAHRPSGPVFNHYDWGGYLIWKLYPSIRVFIDGRADLYGQRLLNQFADTYQLKASWKQPLQDWNISTVIVPSTSALATGLRGSQDWILSYDDGQAVILTARPATTDFNLPQDPVTTTFVKRRRTAITLGRQESTPAEAFCGLL